jgi:UDP-glucuronate 4-epimerase
MNILITGGAGFIGSHLVERCLSRGHAVTVLDDFNDYYPPALKRANIAAARSKGAFGVVEGDLRDKALAARLLAERKPDVVVHLAARAGVRPSWADPFLYHDVNVTGALRLLEAMREAGVRRMVFASSSSVYGNADTVPFREDAESLHPISPYGATKLMGEHYLRVFHELEGFEAVCLRLFTAYGPRQRPDMAIRLFARAILRGDPVPLFGDGTMQRDFTYVDDIVDGVMAAVERPPAGFHVINLGGARTVEVRAVVDLLAKAIGRPARIETKPAPPGDVRRTYADVTKARRLLGFNPTVDVAEGIERFLAWYRSEKCRIANEEC